MTYEIVRILNMITNPHYLCRMIILHAISLLAPVMGPDVTCNKLLPIVINSSKDRVPNIKFNVAKVLQSLVPVVEQSVVDQTIRPCLAELSEDPDVDVRYFASQAVQACDQGYRDGLTQFGVIAQPGWPCKWSICHPCRATHDLAGAHGCG
ncbi:hypothetical protein EJ110_NYTH45106 [Nymphaea thermarum]|nr:hypothetical protein EJ110_NYTH45106 [Nymphaea thermarum]